MPTKEEFFALEKELIGYLKLLHSPETWMHNNYEDVQAEIKRITAKLNEVLALKHKTWEVDSSERRST